MKVMTIVGTRPELIKLSLVLQEMDKSFDHVLVHSGQNYDFELNEIFFRDLGIRKPDHFLECAAPSAIETIAQVLVRSEKILRDEKPEALLIYGDTNSCLAALSAKRLQIPIFHMEAGNRCFDERVPEEINRRLLDHISDINMPLTEHGRRYLLAEGLPAQRVIKTGSCMFEILRHFQPQIAASKALVDLKLQAGRYFLVSAHREENVDSPERLRALLVALDGLAAEHGLPVIFSVHPRTRKRIEDLTPKWSPSPLIRAMKPLGFFDYVGLQQQAFCVISDSGTLMEESAILGFPAVHCRDAFERPEGMEQGVLVMSPLEPTRLRESIRLVTQSPAAARSPVPDYTIDHVSKTVVRIIQTYTPVIHREVWRR